MSADFHKYLEKILFEKCLNNEELSSGIVVGLSGGPDSVCLLHGLSQILPSEKLLALHLNHSLRGKEADEDEEYCRELCRSLNIKFTSKKVDVGVLAEEEGLSIEECGRNVRYSFFEQEAKKAGFEWVAVAHNRNDQAETVLMNISRGTGLRGLAGMDYVNGRIIRPLLDVSRARIERYCHEFNLNPRTDRSNLSTEYTRNRVRIIGIPVLKEIFNKDIEEQLVRLSHNASEVTDFLENVGDQEYLNVCANLKGPAVKINAEKFKKLHNAVGHIVLCKAIERIFGSTKGFGTVHFDAITKIINSNVSGKRLNLHKGLVAQYAYGEVLLSLGDKESHVEPFEEKLNIPGKTECKGYKFHTTIIKKEGAKEKYSQTSKIIFIDCDKIEDELKIRNRRQGDRIRPWKSTGTKKLKKYYIDKKIPREEREKYILVADGSNIVWIVGIELDKRYLISDNTKNILKIELI